jgi:hypothetical protein
MKNTVGPERNRCFSKVATLPLSWPKLQIDITLCGCASGSLIFRKRHADSATSLLSSRFFINSAVIFHSLPQNSVFWI